MIKRTIFAMLLTAALLAFFPSCKKDPKAPVMTYEAVEGTLTFTANGVSFRMIPVEGGTFTMGATAEQGSDADSDEKPTHSVTLSSYYMGETEVTQALWQAVMGSNPSHSSGNNLPVEQVSWNDCQTFITALNELCASQLNGKQFALPTEAQWEYAARGGNRSHDYKYSGSNDLGNVAWFDDSSGRTHTVGTKQANELGFYDMSGNVFEWCSDWYGGYGSSAQTDPTGPASGSNRVYRGGSWYYYMSRWRVSCRAFINPDFTSDYIGMRLALVTNENSNPLLPTVTTSQVSDITLVSAVSGGNVTDDGGSAVTERGICWSTSHNPTTSGNHANSGTGTGSFSVQMTGLTPGTTYYVRAYAKNSAGTAYGSEVSFTTQSGGGSGTLTFTANGVTFEMIEVEGGTFWMGAQSTNPSGQNYDSEAHSSEQPVRQVTLSSYHIGKFEVTQQLWQAVMGSNPSNFSGSNLPVETVSWNDCQAFITALNELCAGQLNGKHFALPTEAQWEFAARGGKHSQGYKYSGSNTIGDVAWYDSNSGMTTHAVGTKTPNELGLYDMSGNVYEWCSDRYGSYGSGAQTDPTGPASGSSRARRGGNWIISARDCRVSKRVGNFPNDTYDNIGLRLAL